MKVLLSVLLCMVLMGCTSPMLSMNKKLAYADSGATLSAAMAIDQIPVEKFDATKVEIVSVCADLSKFLDDGKLADLPLDKAKLAIEDYLIKKGWQAYVSLVEVVFAWVSVQQVTLPIGTDNVLVIKQGLDGIARQATRAKKEWTVPFKVVAPSADTTKGKSLQFIKK